MLPSMTVYQANETRRRDFEATAADERRARLVASDPATSWVERARRGCGALLVRAGRRLADAASPAPETAR